MTTNEPAKYMKSKWKGGNPNVDNSINAKNHIEETFSSQEMAEITENIKKISKIQNDIS